MVGAQNKVNWGDSSAVHFVVCFNTCLPFPIERHWKAFQKIISKNKEAERPRLTLKKHIDSVLIKCENVINVICSLSLGAGQNIHLMSCMISLIGGCLRVWLKYKQRHWKYVMMPRTTPMPALLLNILETPMGIWPSKLVMQYIIKLKGHQGEHPVKLVLKNALEWGGEKRKKEFFIFKISNEVENL